MNANDRDDVVRILNFLLDDFDFGYPAYEERWAIKKALDAMEAQKDLLEASKDALLIFSHEIDYPTTRKKLQKSIEKSELA